MQHHTFPDDVIGTRHKFIVINVLSLFFSLIEVQFRCFTLIVSSISIKDGAFPLTTDATPPGRWSFLVRFYFLLSFVTMFISLPNRLSFLLSSSWLWCVHLVLVSFIKIVSIDRFSHDWIISCIISSLLGVNPQVLIKKSLMLKDALIVSTCPSFLISLLSLFKCPVINC